MPFHFGVATAAEYLCIVTWDLLHLEYCHVKLPLSEIWMSEEGFPPASQKFGSPSEGSMEHPISDEDIDSDVPQDSSLYSSGFNRPFKTPARGGKRPIFSPVDEDDQPDLEEYFSGWEIPTKDQILMCRAYASYLSVKQKPRTRR